MNKLTFTLNKIWISAILFSALSAQGMENNTCKALTIWSKHQSFHSHVLNYKALQANQYNNNVCLLTSLPNEKLMEIFSHCLVNDINQVKSLVNSIKNYMKMNTVCKNFNQLLTFEGIGNFCKNYNQSDKSQTLKNLIKTMETSYEINRPLALILVYAGTNAKLGTLNSNMLLHMAPSANDTQLVKALFKYHANPSANAQVCKSTLALFKARTVEMAHIFIDNGANIAAANGDNIFPLNVLWSVVRSGYQSELIEFYLSHHIDAKQVSTNDNSCLFHELVKAQQVYVMDTADDLLKKAKLLLDVIPNMINTVDKYGRTPVDVAQLRLELNEKYDDPKVLKQLITLFREHNGVAAQELEQNKTIQITIL